MPMVETDLDRRHAAIAAEREDLEKKKATLMHELGETQPYSFPANAPGSRVWKDKTERDFIWRGRGCVQFSLIRQPALDSRASWIVVVLWTPASRRA